jgi:hypothetical protein
LHIAKRRVKAANKILLNDDDWMATCGDTPIAQYKQIVMEHFKWDFVYGSSLNTLLNPPSLLVQTINASIVNLEIVSNLIQNTNLISPTIHLPLALPWVDIFHGVEPAYAKAIGDHIGMNRKANFRVFLNSTHLDIIPIISFASSSKMDLLANTALLFIRCSNISKIYSSTPTNIAMDNLTKRINRNDRHIADSLDRKHTCPQIVHDHSLQSKMKA